MEKELKTKDFRDFQLYQELLEVENVIERIFRDYEKSLTQKPQTRKDKEDGLQILL